MGLKICWLLYSIQGVLVSQRTVTANLSSSLCMHVGIAACRLVQLIPLTFTNAPFGARGIYYSSRRLCQGLLASTIHGPALLGCPATWLPESSDSLLRRSLPDCCTMTTSFSSFSYFPQNFTSPRPFLLTLGLGKVFLPDRPNFPNLNWASEWLGPCQIIHFSPIQASSWSRWISIVTGEIFPSVDLTSVQANARSAYLPRDCWSL